MLGPPGRHHRLPLRPRRRPDRHGRGPRPRVEADVRRLLGDRGRSTRAPTTTATSTASRARTGSATSSPRATSSRATPRSRGSSDAKNDLVLKLIHDEGVEAYRRLAPLPQGREGRRAAPRRRLLAATTPRTCSTSPAWPTHRGARRRQRQRRARPARQARAGHVPGGGAAARRAARPGRGLRGRARGRRRPGRAGKFGHVVGVDRVGQREALLEHGADIVVDDLAELL